EPWIIPPFWAGAFAIGLFYGAYMTETFRGAMLAVPRGQSEAGLALGLARGAVFWRVVFPQMIRHALPGIRNNWLVLLKATALVSVIGLSDDMMAVAGQAKAKTHQPFLFYAAAAAGYLFLTALSEAAFNFLEKRAGRGVWK
ncbi:MAG: ABC transporter permease subunit, partial [Gammaproteobacteria bacterium]